MKPMSLRGRLVLATLLVVGATLVATSTAVYVAFGRGLQASFAARLVDEARTVANMVEERAVGAWEWEPGIMGDFERVAEPAYFEVWMDDGTLIARSPSLEANHLPRGTGQPNVIETHLPDGRHGRLLTLALAPRLDNEGPATPSGRKVFVTIARSTKEVDSALGTLRALLLVGGLAGLALSALAAVLSIGVGMRPLDQLAARLDRIQANTLGERVVSWSLPRELVPMADKLNELLARIESAFAHEKRFTADVAHELRNPLAALRTLLEVSLSRERPVEAQVATHREALAVVGQLSTMVERLLLLNRVEQGVIAGELTSVALRELVDEVIAAYIHRATERHLQIENRIPLSATEHTDAALLRIAVGNLLGNAVEYTHEGGRVEIDSDSARGLVIALGDSGPTIPEAMLPHIFERFYRGDVGRGGTGEHSGIGLSLVSAIAAALDMTVTVKNDERGWVRFSLHRRVVG